MSFSARVKQSGADTEVFISGILDERAQLPPMTPPAGALRIDLAELTMINSIGCRQWVNWIRGVSAASGVSLVNCSPATVHQIGILVGFLPENVSVASFFVPYTCSDCEREALFLVNCAKLTVPGDLKGLEAANCPFCKGAMSIDVIPARYFKFLQPAQ